VHINDYQDIIEAKSIIGVFLEQLYNRKRLHSSIGYLSLDDFEKNC